MAKINNLELFNIAMKMLKYLPVKSKPSILGSYEGGKATQADKPSAHSSLSSNWAERAGKALAERIYTIDKTTNISVHSVANTNSMEPLFDDNCKVCLEELTPVILARQPLVAGDIITYEAVYKGVKTSIIHRLHSKTTFLGEPAWIVWGDNNFVPDGKVREKLIKRRLVGIIYGKQKRDGD